MTFSEKETKQAKIIIFFILLFSLVTYGVLYSSLVLFITNGLKFDGIIAISIAATFLAFHFSYQIIGGFFTGRIFSHRIALLIGLSLQTIGCSLLSFNNLSWGLALFMVGTGFNLVCLNCILTQFFHPDDNSRESAFIYNYIAMNIGIIIGVSISGLFEINYRYELLFIFATISNLIPISFMFYKWKLLQDQNTIHTTLSKKKKLIYFFSGILFICLQVIASNWLILNSDFSNKLIFFIGISMISFVAYSAIKQKDKTVKKKLWAYFIFIFMCLIFWILYLMTPLGLTLFVENNVNRTIFEKLIPPQWAINISSLTILLSAPILVSLFKYLRAKGYNVTITNQFLASLFSISLAFLILPIGIIFADKNGYVNFSFVAISYALQGLGEILIAPIGFAMIGRLISHKQHGIMMGIWIMLVGVAATISNIFSKFSITQTPSENPLDTNPHFLLTFSSLAILAIVAGLTLLALAKSLNKLMDHLKQTHKN